MNRAVPVPLVESPPPSYESVVGNMEPLYVPPRYLGPTEGRSSIRYTQLPPLYDTTKLFFIDNKSADIASLNYQNNHSNYLTSVVQNSDYTPQEASTQTINFDDRSRWGANFKTILHMNMPNINEFMYSNSFRVKLMVEKKDGKATYDWVTLTIPEGNYSDIAAIDMMNNAIVENYLEVGRNNGVAEDEIGVKFDTRNFRLGYDPVTGLVMPGKYTYMAVHPDIILAPGCAVDFTTSRLNNLLGIRKRLPFQEGFQITYEDLVGGNIPALLDVQNYDENDPTTIRPITEDPSRRSYHVGEDPTVRDTFTYYRSWYLAYNYGDPLKGIRNATLLVTPDVTCGMEQVYWSIPDMYVEPVTFKASQNVSNYPVIGVELMPQRPRSFYNAQAVYSQMIQENTNQTMVFNRFPDNQIFLRPPESTITSISENVPTQTDHGTLPIRNSVSGVQRVTLTDARRRASPYVYKSIAVAQPKVLSSRTF
ncbi:III protein [Bovine adenovirus 2]|nr:III protein [Bovine adenovirus 2]